MNKEEAYTRLSNSCARKEMCKQDAYKWLIKFKIPKEFHNEIVDKLIDGQFIDEQRYSYAYANDSLKYSKWGKIKISYQLQSKHINKEYIDKAINNLDNDLYEEIRQQLAESKRNIISDDDPQKEMKVKAYLCSRGF